jgi:hypothetical protein
MDCGLSNQINSKGVDHQIYGFLQKGDRQIHQLTFEDNGGRDRIKKKENDAQH